MSLYPCPRCGAPSSPEQCANCGRGYEPLLTELANVDGHLGETGRSMTRLREQLRSTEETHTLLIAKRSRILGRLSERGRELRRPTPAAPATPPPTSLASLTPPPQPIGVPTPPVPQPISPQRPPQGPPLPASSRPMRKYGPTPQPGPRPTAQPKKETSGKVAQNTLLILGAILATVAAISFTTVAWVTFGTGGRAAILGVVTLIALLVPFVLKKRGLTATAETVSAIGLLLVVLDGVALWLLNVIDTVDAGVFVASTAIVAAVFGLLYHRLSALVVPLYAVPLLGLFAALVAVNQEATTIALILLCAISLLATTAAIAGREPYAKIASGGLAAATVIGTVTYLTAHHAPTLMLLLPAIATVVVSGCARRLPADARLGPVSVAWVATGLVAAVAFYDVLRAVVVSVADATGSVDRITNPERLWQAPIVVALLVLGEFAAPKHRWRHDVAVGGTTLIALAVPGAFGIDWHYTVPALIALAAVGAFAARYGTPAQSGTRLAGTGVVYAMGIGLSLTDRLYTAAALSTVLVVGVLLFVLRKGSRRMLTAGLGLAGAVWVFPGVLALWADRAGLAPPYVACLALVTVAVLATASEMWQPMTGPLSSLPIAGTAAALITTGGVILTQDPGIERYAATLAILLGLFSVAVAAEASQPNLQGALTRRILAAGGVLVLLATCTTLAYRLAPGFEVLVTVVLAGLVGLAARSAPRALRAGPGIGAAIAGGLAAGVAAMIALAAGFVSIAAAFPMWSVHVHSWDWTIAHVRWLGWQPPVVLLIAGLATATLLRGPLRHHLTLAAAGLALLSAPVAWRLDWWVTPVVAIAAAVILGSFAARGGAYAYPRFGVGVAFALYGLVTSLHTPAATVAATGTVAAACLLVSGLASGGRQPVVGGIATGAGILILPAIAVSGVVAANAPDQDRTAVLASVGAASLGLLIAALLRVGGSRNLPYATVAVPVAATIAAYASLATHEPTRVYAALAALIGVASALLHLPDKALARWRAALAVPTLGVAAVAVSPVVLAPLVLPYSWLTAAWSRVPVSTVDGLSVVPVTPPGNVRDVAVLAAIAVAACLAVLGLAGRRWLAPVAIAALGAVLLAVPVAFDLPWPTGPYVTLAIAVVAAVVAGLGTDARQGVICVVIAAVTGAPALTGSLATRPTTVTTLGVIVVIACVIAFAGRNLGSRVTGYIFGGAALTALAMTAGLAVGLPTGQIALGVLGSCLVLLAVASVTGLFHGRTPEVITAETMAHLSLVPALALAASEPTVRPLATVFAVYGAILGLYALRIGAGAVRRTYAVAAAIGELLAYWLLLAYADVGTIEAYTLPVAIIALVGGGLELRRRPNLRSWLGYGPGLLAVFAPTLAPVLVSPGEPWRRFALGAGALLVLLVGSVKRWQAPVVIGGAVLAIVALHELVLMWTLVPAWLPLTVAAVLLLGAGATFEQRRRDLRKLKAVVGGMR